MPGQDCDNVREALLLLISDTDKKAGPIGTSLRGYTVLYGTPKISDSLFTDY